MRPTAPPLFQHQMGLITGHQPFVVLGGGDSEGLHSFDQVILDKLDRLEGTIGLLGKYQRGVVQFARTVGQRAVAEIGHQYRSAQYDRGDQNDAASDQQRYWPQAPDVRDRRCAGAGREFAGWWRGSLVFADAE